MVGWASQGHDLRGVGPGRELRRGEHRAQNHRRVGGERAFHRVHHHLRRRLRRLRLGQLVDRLLNLRVIGRPRPSQQLVGVRARREFRRGKHLHQDWQQGRRARRLRSRGRHWPSLSASNGRGRGRPALHVHRLQRVNHQPIGRLRRLLGRHLRNRFLNPLVFRRPRQGHHFGRISPRGELRRREHRAEDRGGAGGQRPLDGVDHHLRRRFRRLRLSQFVDSFLDLHVVRRTRPSQQLVGLDPLGELRHGKHQLEDRQQGTGADRPRRGNGLPSFGAFASLGGRRRGRTAGGGHRLQRVDHQLVGAGGRLALRHLSNRVLDSRMLGRPGQGRQLRHIAAESELGLRKERTENQHRVGRRHAVQLVDHHRGRRFRRLRLGELLDRLLDRRVIARQSPRHQLVALGTEGKLGRGKHLLQQRQERRRRRLSRGRSGDRRSALPLHHRRGRARLAGSDLQRVHHQLIVADGPLLRHLRQRALNELVLGRPRQGQNLVRLQAGGELRLGEHVLQQRHDGRGRGRLHAIDFHPRRGFHWLRLGELGDRLLDVHVIGRPGPSNNPMGFGGRGEAGVGKHRLEDRDGVVALPLLERHQLRLALGAFRPLGGRRNHQRGRLRLRQRQTIDLQREFRVGAGLEFLRHLGQDRQVRLASPRHDLANLPVSGHAQVGQTLLHDPRHALWIGRAQRINHEPLFAVAGGPAVHLGQGLFDRRMIAGRCPGDDLLGAAVEHQLDVGEHRLEHAQQAGRIGFDHRIGRHLQTLGLGRLAL